jgi:hypothetical protein
VSFLFKLAATPPLHPEEILERLLELLGPSHESALCLDQRQRRGDALAGEAEIAGQNRVHVQLAGNALDRLIAFGITPGGLPRRYAKTMAMTASVMPAAK